MSSTVTVAVLPPTESFTAAGTYFTQVPIAINADLLWAVVGAADLSGVTLSINGSTPGVSNPGSGTPDVDLTAFVDGRIDAKLIGN
jgi:hypothetical protein